jgi:hypothetical protein
VEKRHI